MEKEFATIGSIDEVAKRLHISSEHLSRSFHSECRLKKVVDEYNNRRRDEAYANEVLDDVAEQLAQRNAIFMENEINGIHVEDWIIEKFAGLDRAQGEELGAGKTERDD